MKKEPLQYIGIHGYDVCIPYKVIIICGCILILVPDNQIEN